MESQEITLTTVAAIRSWDASRSNLAIVVGTAFVLLAGAFWMSEPPAARDAASITASEQAPPGEGSLLDSVFRKMR